MESALLSSKLSKMGVLNVDQCFHAYHCLTLHCFF